MPRYLHNPNCHKANIVEWFSKADDMSPRIKGWLCLMCGRLTIDTAEITEEGVSQQDDIEHTGTIDNTH